MEFKVRIWDEQKSEFDYRYIMDTPTNNCSRELGIVDKNGTWLYEDDIVVAKIGETEELRGTLGVDKRGIFILTPSIKKYVSTLEKKAKKENTEMTLELIGNIFSATTY